MSKLEANIELLKAMDTVVGYLNDGEAAGPWLTCGVPDGATDDDYEHIASDDELMDWACASFGRVMRMASKDGWFTGFGSEPPFVAYGEVGQS